MLVLQEFFSGSVCGFAAFVLTSLRAPRLQLQHGVASCFWLHPPPRINHFTWPASEVSSESLPAAQSVRSLRKMPGMTEAVYCISAASLQRTASFPCIVCVFRHRLLLFAFYRLLWLAAFSSLSEARGMLFTAVICNQQTRSPLNPLVSSMDVAGEMELWLMHGLFCLWERGRVCDLLQ